VQERGRFVLVRHATPQADDDDDDDDAAAAEPAPARPQPKTEARSGGGEGDAAEGGAQQSSPPMPAGVRRSLVQAAAHLDGLRHSLDLSPLSERAGGDRLGDSLAASSAAWDGLWAEDDPLAIFDERLHPLHAPLTPLANSEPVRKCATPTVNAVANWVRSLATTARMGAEASVVALAYIERLVSSGGFPLDATTWRRCALTAWLLAAKMWDDECFENPEFASIFGYDVNDLNALEQRFVRCLNFRLGVSPTEYARYYFALRSICQETTANFALRPLDAELEAKLASRAAAVSGSICTASRWVEGMQQAVLDGVIEDLSRSI